MTQTALPSERLGIGDIKPMLQRRAAELVRQLCPGGRKEGRTWTCPNPRRGKDGAGSFVVWLTGEAAGAWKEYDAGDCEKGDILQLIVYTGQAPDLPAALKWAKDWLGLTTAAAPEIVRLREEHASRERERDEAEQKRREWLRTASKAIWLGAKPLKPGDPGWIYLEDARGIDLAALTKKRADALRSIRVHPRLEYRWPDADSTPIEWRTLRPRSGTSFHPALVCALSPANDGPNAGVHRTYLASDGLSKARVIKAKKMMGQQLGCAMKVWRGETGLSGRDAAKKGLKGTLVLTEGLEDALSCAVSTPEHRVWAVGSLAGLNALPWPACASEIIVFADNDWKDQARDALDRAVARLAQLGPVKIARSPIGKDANDLLRARRRTSRA